MATISLKINIVDSSMVKTIMFDPTMTVYDACRMIRDRLAEPISNRMCAVVVPLFVHSFCCFVKSLLALGVMILCLMRCLSTTWCQLVV